MKHVTCILRLASIVMVLGLTACGGGNNNTDVINPPVTPATDTSPNAFTFNAQTAIETGSIATSNAIVVAGMNASAPISVVGGQYAIDGGAFTEQAGTVQTGQSIQVRLTAANIPSTTSNATLTIGGVSADFTVTTAAEIDGGNTGNDTTPDAFTLLPQLDVAVFSDVVSNDIIITGINAAAPISIVGGAYAIDEGEFTQAPGTIKAGQHVVVRLTSAETPLTTSNATLTIGGVSADFTVTTEQESDGGTTVTEDTTPDAFSFTAQIDVELNETVSSNSITVSGINVATSISIVGGEYSIDDINFAGAASTIEAGQTVVVRVTASDSPEQTTRATLTIGGVSADFNVTTPAAITPDEFSFSPPSTEVSVGEVISDAIIVSGIETAAPISIVGGEYNIDGGDFTQAPGSVVAGQSVRIRLKAATATGASLSAKVMSRVIQKKADTQSITVTATLTIGSVTADFSAKIVQTDTSPDSFSFSAQNEVLLNTQIESAAIITSGINATTAISIVGGEYAIDGGDFTAASGSVSQGQSVKVRLKSSDIFAQTTQATLTIGGVSADFKVTTLAIDTSPDSFSFAAQSDVELSTQVLSNTITLSGINTAAPISVTGGEYAIDGGNFTVTAGSITAGQSVRLRLSTSSGFDRTTRTTLTIGGVSADFTASTRAADTRPSSFSFTPQTDVALSAQVVSDSITVRGIETAVSISIVGGEYAIDGGSFTSAAGGVSQGQSVKVRLTSSDSPLTTTSATLVIGGRSAAFVVTTDRGNAAPVAIIAFPPAKSFTTRNIVVVRGSATDAEGDEITGVTINGVNAQSDDNFATWQAEVNLAFGQNTLVVQTRDAQNNIDNNATNLEIESGAPSFSNPINLTLDIQNNRAIVLDGGSNTLFAVDINTGERTVLSGQDPVSGEQVGSGLSFSQPTALVFDSLNNRVFVVDNGLDVLFGVNLTNGNRVVFSGLEAGSGPELSSPKAITLESTDSVLILDDVVDSVFRVDLASGERTIIASDDVGDGPQFSTPSAMVLDTANNRLLVTDNNTLNLIAVDLSTGQRTLLFSQDADQASPAVTTKLPLTSAVSLALDSESDRVFVLDRSQCLLVAINLVTGQQDITSFSVNSDCDAETDFPQEVESVGAGVVFLLPVAVAFDDAQHRAVVVDKSLGLMLVDISTGNRTVLSSTDTHTQSTEPTLVIIGDIIFDNTKQRLIVSTGEYSSNGKLLFGIDAQTGERDITFDGSSLNSTFKALTTAGSLLFASNGVSDANLSEVDSVQEINLTTGDTRTLTVNSNNDDILTKLRDVKAVAFDEDTGLASVLIGLVIRFDGQLEPRVLAFDTRESVDAAANPQFGQRFVVSGNGIGSGPQFVLPKDMVRDDDRLLVIDSAFRFSDPSERQLFAVNISQDNNGDINGNRTIVSNVNHGNGPDFVFPLKLVLDKDKNRVLVLDEHVSGGGVNQVIAVDLVTGDRTLLVDPEQGSGPAFKSIEDIALANNGTLLYAFEQTNRFVLVVDLVTQQRVVLSRGDVAIVE